MSDEKKIGVVVLWKNNDAYWELAPEKLAKWVEEGNDIFVRWEEKVKRVVSYHSVGMSRFDVCVGLNFNPTNQPTKSDSRRN